jgi:hypothetical protein
VQTTVIDHIYKIIFTFVFIRVSRLLHHTIAAIGHLHPHRRVPYKGGRRPATALHLRVAGPRMLSEAGAEAEAEAWQRQRGQGGDGAVRCRPQRARDACVGGAAAAAAAPPLCAVMMMRAAPPSAADWSTLLLLLQPGGAWIYE